MTTCTIKELDMLIDDYQNDMSFYSNTYNQDVTVHPVSLHADVQIDDDRYPLIFQQSEALHLEANPVYESQFVTLNTSIDANSYFLNRIDQEIGNDDSTLSDFYENELRPQAQKAYEDFVSDNC